MLRCRPDCPPRNRQRTGNRFCRGSAGRQPGLLDALLPGEPGGRIHIREHSRRVPQGRCEGGQWLGGYAESLINDPSLRRIRTGTLTPSGFSLSPSPTIFQRSSTQRNKCASNPVDSNLYCRWGDYTTTTWDLGNYRTGGPMESIRTFTRTPLSHLGQPGSRCACACALRMQVEVDAS